MTNGINPVLGVIDNIVCYFVGYLQADMFVAGKYIMGGLGLFKWRWGVLCSIGYLRGGGESGR